jgi:hypothetical protein
VPALYGIVTLMVTPYPAPSAAGSYTGAFDIESVAGATCRLYRTGGLQGNVYSPSGGVLIQGDGHSGWFYRTWPASSGSYTITPQCRMSTSDAYQSFPAGAIVVTWP